LQAVAFWLCQLGGGVGKVFHLMVARTRAIVSVFGCRSLPASFREGFVFYVRCLSCLNNVRRFMMGVSVHNHSWRVCKFYAQQSVHPTLGSLRHLKHFSTPEHFPSWTASPSPAPAQVTPTVGRFLATDKRSKKGNLSS